MAQIIITEHHQERTIRIKYIKSNGEVKHLFNGTIRDDPDSFMDETVKEILRKIMIRLVDRS